MMNSNLFSDRRTKRIFGLTTAISLAFTFASVATVANGQQPLTWQTKRQSAQPTQPVRHAQSTGQAKLASFNENVRATEKTNLKTVGFRLIEWKTIHADSEASAQESVASLKKIGCEVEMNNHGNHIDVRYRCPQWKAMELPSDQLAAQWTSWLKGKSLETVVVNPPANTKSPTVMFRLSTPKTLHLHDPQKANEIVGTLRLIGVEVSVNNHGNHIDATFQCPNWTTIELPSDSNAHVWQKWLNESGFETKHTH